MKVLDLFSGLNGWSQAFMDRGHDVITIDNQHKFKPTICADIMKLTHQELRDNVPLGFDIIMASPPCNCFSVASVYRHWDKETGKPKDEATRESIRLVGHTINLILNLQPRFWILENPRGMMRRVLGQPNITTFMACWGTSYLKPTDLWGALPPMKWPHPTRWEKDPRGSKKGIQGLVAKGAGCGKGGKDLRPNTPALRAKIPYALSEAVCLACEKVIK